MLLLHRRPGQSLLIGDLTVTMLSSCPRRCRVRISRTGTDQAPADAWITDLCLDMHGPRRWLPNDAAISYRRHGRRRVLALEAPANVLILRRELLGGRHHPGARSFPLAFGSGAD